jgi:tetratricopeptide (TPR) repeat protein
MRDIIRLLCLLAITSFSAFGQEPLAQEKKAIYQAFITNRMDIWNTTLQKMEDKVRHDMHPTNLFELAVAHYGYTAFSIGNKNTEAAKVSIDKAESLLNYLTNDKNFRANALALKAGLTGLKMGMNRFKAFSLGPKAIAYLKEAEALDSLNPYALMERGNMKFHAPAIFGGSYSEAAKFYKKSLTVMRQRGLDRYNWLYLNTMVCLGRSYEAAKDYSRAKNVYEAILKEEPGFLWVKQELYPQLVGKNEN